ncbi:hypothetical protein GCM10022247_34840 [Allokutzneria multivorans]|uniref:Uncharacterized protein n=1 Tax=Allokutzneria multivorans TaxID=1142134 RepID=A0ABP7SCA3_9PSEU
MADTDPTPVIVQQPTAADPPNPPPQKASASEPPAPATDPEPSPGEGAPSADPEPVRVANPVVFSSTHPRLTATGSFDSHDQVLRAMADLYEQQPELASEHALLGSLTHAPAMLAQLAFLAPRAFSTEETQAVWGCLAGLQRDGALFDVASLADEPARQRAATENYSKLLHALRNPPASYTPIKLADPAPVIAMMRATAPPESVPLQGTYAPQAQAHLAQRVVTAKVKRSLDALGGIIQSAGGIQPASTTPAPAPYPATTKLATAEGILAQLSTHAQNLANSMQRPDVASASAPAHARRVKIPQLLRPVLRPVRSYYEQRLLHVMMHGGDLSGVPAPILALGPDVFSKPEHANLWRTIHDIRGRGAPVNFPEVFAETKRPGFVHKPVPSTLSFLKWAGTPSAGVGTVNRALVTIVGSAQLEASQSRLDKKTLAVLTGNGPVETHDAVQAVSTVLNALSRRAQASSWAEPTRAPRSASR